MAKKRESGDPVIESMLVALQELFTGIICYAINTVGPSGAITVMDKILANATDQRAELVLMSDDFNKQVTDKEKT